MIGATIFAVVFFVFLIAICIGFIILQIRLSKMDSKWPGLVLPAITLLLSLVAAITVFARADIAPLRAAWMIKPVTWSQGSSRNRSRTPCHFG